MLTTPKGESFWLWDVFRASLRHQLAGMILRANLIVFPRILRTDMSSPPQKWKTNPAGLLGGAKIMLERAGNHSRHA